MGSKALMPTEQTADLMQFMMRDLARMAAIEQVRCRICGRAFTGKDWGDVLQQLGEHGDAEHAELSRKIANCWHRLIGSLPHDRTNTQVQSHNPAYLYPLPREILRSRKLLLQVL